MHQVVEPLDGVAGFRRRRAEVERVPAADGEASVSPARAAAGFERADALERRARRAGCPEREHLVQAGGIEGAGQLPAREQRLHLGAEVKVAGPLSIIQRQNAEPVAGEQQRSVAPVIDDEGELAVQPVEHRVAPLGVGVQQNLGVAACPEHVATSRQLVFEAGEIEDLAVIHDDEGAVAVRHRLRAPREVDDTEPRVREADALVGVQAEAVRAAMADRRGHALEHRRRHAARLAPGNACEPAHQSVSETRSTSSGAACW